MEVLPKMNNILLSEKPDLQQEARAPRSRTISLPNNGPVERKGSASVRRSDVSTKRRKSAVSSQNTSAGARSQGTSTGSRSQGSDLRAPKIQPKIRKPSSATENQRTSTTGKPKTSQSSGKPVAVKKPMVRKVSNSGRPSEDAKKKNSADSVKGKRFQSADTGVSSGVKTGKKAERPASTDKTQVANTKFVDQGSTQEVHEEKMITLKQIVTQAELDRKIFCIFERRRYVIEPVREELTRRGWLEYRPEKEIVARKPRLATPAIPAASPVDRTSQAILGSSVAEPYFHVAAPLPRPRSSTTNQDILEYGHKFETLPNTTAKPNRKSSYRTFSPEELQKVGQLIQEANARMTMTWLSAKPNVQLQFYEYTPYIANKFQKTTFCSKFGLWSNLNERESYPRTIKFPIQVPRMYNFGDDHSRSQFVLDFYVTASTSILRWLVTRLSVQGAEGVQHEKGEVPARVFEFAIKKCKMLVSYLTKGATVTQEDLLRTEGHWETFLFWFYKVINEKGRMKRIPTEQMYLLHCRSVEVLRALRMKQPDMDNDGLSNIWILKPYSAACGRGIFITNNFYYLQALDQNRYIIQKYIERPYLIAGTKFDIRQWLMVTSLRPLQVWIYKECYLRFCTVPFDLYNFHESIHLSNNAVQKRYTREVGLPHQNMWDSKTFQKYLTEIGHPTLWQDRIYPGMRDGIACALLASQPTFDQPDAPRAPRPGWFEIYGADFMLTQNLREGPWLIEINEGPALDPSTPVTARLCQQMLRDVIKVVVDWRKNPKADTGGWEIAYQQEYIPGDIPLSRH